MTVTIETSDLFDASVLAAALRYGGPLRVTAQVFKFIRWKERGGPCPFSADKASGARADGTVVLKFRELNLRHCHMDLSGTDPLLAYREWPEGRVLILCLTDHKEMFGGEKAFWTKVKSLPRGQRVP